MGQFHLSKTAFNSITKVGAFVHDGGGAFARAASLVN
jgi:hypothetical protein